MDGGGESPENTFMASSFDPRAASPPPELRLLVETDRRELVRFLQRDPVSNIYLLSRIAVDGVVNEESTAHGRFYGHAQNDVLDGVVFFGHRKGMVLAGEGETFVRSCADLALGAESEWIILVGPRTVTDAFLSHYRWRGRPTHINRVQDFYVLRHVDPGFSLAPIERAEQDDLDDIVEMSEQMLLEDFRLNAGSLSREGIRESMRQKIADGRSWVCREHGEIVFKVDVSAQFAGGSQIEGVFTRPHRRGRGYARRGVAALSAELLGSSAFVSLHVDRENLAARRAYEKAGFRPHAEFRLVLLNVG